MRGREPVSRLTSFERLGQATPEVVHESVSPQKKKTGQFEESLINGQFIKGEGRVKGTPQG